MIAQFSRYAFRSLYFFFLLFALTSILCYEIMTCCNILFLCVLHRSCIFAKGCVCGLYTAILLLLSYFVCAYFRLNIYIPTLSLHFCFSFLSDWTAGLHVRPLRLTLGAVTKLIAYIHLYKKHVVESFAMHLININCQHRQRVHREGNKLVGIQQK